MSEAMHQPRASSDGTSCPRHYSQARNSPPTILPGSPLHPRRDEPRTRLRELAAFLLAHRTPPKSPPSTLRPRRTKSAPCRGQSPNRSQSPTTRRAPDVTPKLATLRPRVCAAARSIRAESKVQRAKGLLACTSHAESPRIFARALPQPSDRRCAEAKHRTPSLTAPPATLRAGLRPGLAIRVHGERQVLFHYARGCMQKDTSIIALHITFAQSLALPSQQWRETRGVEVEIIGEQAG